MLRDVRIYTWVSLLTLASALSTLWTGERWVVANFKESQIANIKPGSEVIVEVDAVPGVEFKGVVRTISRATGGSMSVLPQDNSSGNFIKIEQRIPVLIDFTEDNRAEDLARVGAGMNVECTVKY